MSFRLQIYILLVCHQNLQPVIHAYRTYLSHSSSLITHQHSSTLSKTTTIYRTHEILSNISHIAPGDTASAMHSSLGLGLCSTIHGHRSNLLSTQEPRRITKRRPRLGTSRRSQHVHQCILGRQSRRYQGTNPQSI